MTFKDLENGMAVQHANGSYGMVFKGFMTYNYIIYDSGKNEVAIKALDEKGNLQKLEYFNIVEVRSVKNYCNDTFLENAANMYDAGRVVWSHSVVEMTLEEVCKALGKDIKIVKEK